MSHARHSILFLILLPLTASGQFSGGIQVGALIDDNVFNNYLQIADRVTEVSLQGAYDWDTESTNLQLFYTGMLDYFAHLPSRTFQVHTAGLAYSHALDEHEGALLNVGGDYALRDNRDEYAIYDHSQISLYGNLQWDVTDPLRLKGGYAFRTVAFAELQEFDYTEHVLFIQASTSLPTRTTFIVQGDLGFKTYATPNADTTTTSYSRRQWGRREAETSTPGVTQLITTVRIGQGITETTGLSLTGQYQLSLDKESRYLTFDDGVVTDDEIFDDHYGFDGPLIGLTATQILPADVQIRATGSIQERQYSNRPAYDLAGTLVASQRIDTRGVLSLSVDKSFPSLGLRASLVYDHINNASNDAYYSYRNDALSLWLSFLPD
jgi:hypothetical protein